MSKAQHQMAKKGKMENLNPTTSSSQNHFIIVLQSLVENCEKKCRLFYGSKFKYFIFTIISDICNFLT